ncbi:PREDICTED: RNA pseudouridylate synthase domain-containing protein 3 isoform X1 [Thamnophis sirtalis]|uniref:RNA pseudouridylate synthase domain-containing protein 3 isoform X1 n=2 Tax=Thamnophis sirtalis TaxID=35019 RepID=A0A6I9YP56_9SAUR|nr:PREDICTED: RNA pseudouridylate synthase domain-containing protein 3 isoform X1 [Thamnophis sirtalis]
MFGLSLRRVARARGRLRAHFSTPPAWYHLLNLKKVDMSMGETPNKISYLKPLKSLEPDSLLKLLKTSIVHADGTLVAINKPCGIPISGKPEDLTLQSVLPQLSQILNLPQDLQVIKAPEKEGSGLVLLSSCPNTTRYLQDFYSQRKKKKHPVATYCAVTTRTPVATEGEINTGLKMVDVDGFDMVVPVASPSRKSLQAKEVKRTLSYYKVLDSKEGCALLQLQPVTTFRNQLQVHLTLILSPLLGDHMYSSRVGTVLGEPFLLPAEETPPRTQALEEHMMQKLRLRPQVMFRLQLHLHLHQLLLPEGCCSSCTLLVAPPPPFFLQTLRSLGLNLPPMSSKQ